MNVFDAFSTVDLIAEARAGNNDRQLVLELCKRLEAAREIAMDVAHQVSLRGRISPNRSNVEQRAATAHLIELTDGEYTTHSSLANLK